MPSPVRKPKPERWSLDAGDATSATLVVPPDARRERRFEIACALTVAVPQDSHDPWHAMTVLANGTQQWRRQGPAHSAGDGLDYRFAHDVPVGQTLRVTVNTAGQGVRRRTLVIEADEV